jgi:hypothetical protein
MAPNWQEPVARIVAAGASALLLFGCAAPGVPVTRQPVAPRAITDLSAKQSGDSVVLSFSLPKETTQGRVLSKPPAIEIYRSFVAQRHERGAQPSAQPQLFTTIPPQMVDQYRQNGSIRFPDILSSDDFAAHAGNDAIYLVRTRLAKHDSGNSNLVRVHLLPAPERIEDLRALISKTAVKLSWTAPAILPSGSAPPISIRYRIYRTEALGGGQEPSTAKAETQSAAPTETLVGETSTPSYEDTNFTFGRTYAYRVRTVATFEAGTVDSGDSSVLRVTPRDTFAPATPENVAITVTPSQGSGPPHVDLSWAIHSEADLLGYNVYRSDTENSPGARVNTSPLVTPVYRDDSVVPGRRYFYRITAVDKSGNESSPSAPVAVTVPAQTRDDHP